jgi:hypothetical protein
VEIILATTNRAKVRALAERVGAGIVVAPLPSETGERHSPLKLEDGVDATAIARTKASWYSRHIPKMFTAASDGDILIPALGRDWNPARTDRISGADPREATRVEALLARARHLVGPDRQIGWTEALAVARDGEILAEWVAHSPPGELAVDLPDDFDPEAGFWVPYVWRCPEYGGRRLSELTEHERLARRDHWAILGENLTEWAPDQTGSTS